MQWLKGTYLILLVAVHFSSVGQFGDYSKKYNDTIFQEQYEHMLYVIDFSLMKHKKEVEHLSPVEQKKHHYLYKADSIPLFSDSIYCLRLAELNERSPFHLDCNRDVLRTIDFFARKRRQFTSIILGRSALYFPMFEEYLAKHNMPLELKYLSVIESGLRPQVKSRAGALGLWQFMYRTGKMFGLEETSYIDERMDPEKATEAACLYLKQLYGMYNDWNMALAAYNAGPGNVNKAIRRSGGKMTYWEIRPFLPQETQGYVPNFIAMSYLMNYYNEHNIVPTKPVVYDFELDTICLKASLHMETLDSILNWTVEDIKLVNPIYKTNYIPMTEQPQCIKIPVPLLRKFIALEDSIYRLDTLLFHSTSSPPNLVAVSSEPKSTISDGGKVHIVKSGENLSMIARKYGTTVNRLMTLNNLSSTNLKIGQRIRVSGLATFDKYEYASGNQHKHLKQSKIPKSPFGSAQLLRQFRKENL
jgi:membrane-bound lytic murein transglycosylase D